MTDYHPWILVIEMTTDPVNCAVQGHHATVTMMVGRDSTHRSIS